MEISSLHQSNVVSKDRGSSTNKKVERIGTKKEEKSFASTIKELIDDDVIYQNPLLMAAMQDNVHAQFEEFRPDVTADYNVNPVKAIYDSHKAHD